MQSLRSRVATSLLTNILRGRGCRGTHFHMNGFARLSLTQTQKATRNCPIGLGISLKRFTFCQLSSLQWSCLFYSILLAIIFLFRCFQFADVLNECDSGPCINGGTCTDHLGKFECECSNDYSGRQCELGEEF